MVLGIVITIAIELLAPLLAGAVFALRKDPESRLLTVAESYVFGQILLFALFEPAAVFAILRDMELPVLMKIYIPVILAVMIFSWIVIISRKRKNLSMTFKLKPPKPTLCGVLAFMILLFMIIMSFFMTYTDGDDAFYIAVASDAASSESLYFKNPYTGFPTTLLFRYIFAPFPLWISVISKLSGLNTSAVAHSFFPWSMILLSFAVMYIIACRCCEGDTKKRGQFMLFASLLVLFGDYSIYSPSNFLLARSRQGKAALVSFVIPFLMMVLYSAIREMEDKKKVSVFNLFFICASGLAAALCSTMGGILCIGLTFVCSLVIAAVYRKVKYPLLMALFSLPCLLFPALYIIMR